MKNCTIAQGRGRDRSRGGAGRRGPLDRDDNVAWNKHTRESGSRREGHPGGHEV